ncbi:MAG TPA: class I SAM-dependent methyltransferase [Gaiellaceae bacterium]|nr:class I SAM-dependent methyltransferase [Gaiellaceae bacterium]
MKQERWNERYGGAELLWSSTPNRFLVAETEGLAPGRALDLACGEGRNAVWLAERGWRVTGVDFAEAALAKATELAAGRGVELELVHADLVDWVPPPRAYDLVVVLYLQLPAGERGLVLGRAAEAVAPRGTFLLVAHDLSNLTAGHGGPSDPAVLTTADEVATELPGLTVERAECVARPVDGAERPALDTLVRARRR